ncbi:hypothetical protein [Marinobacter persicus]|uniref:Oxidoreductase molybdopterin-binding domain-containing protein n=1 Tax=Marinobacter persicus TaxID=930118 RepID=A0A2S6G2C5_9GAMM|nr:hypothetical protein [Marinobacter persicus]PPK49961.1 hypothetical protein BY455_1408 [Marinobacter persicus]PPK51878.1 hypothetical protein B0H24_10408 [Marinobacter persicus]PPK56545.1 hypothetical protein BY454_1408 [Marinobacter persicus]
MKVLLSIVGLFLSLVSGYGFAAPKLEVTNRHETVVLEWADLEALPQTTIQTTSPYFEGSVEFSGPTLQAVIDQVGLSGESEMTLIALNDYRVSGSVNELLSLDAIVATRRNGKAMSVRQRGPFWLMLPMSDRPELDHEDYHRFMVWQLQRIKLQ